MFAAALLVVATPHLEEIIPVKVGRRGTDIWRPQLDDGAVGEAGTFAERRRL